MCRLLASNFLPGAEEVPSGIRRIGTPASGAMGLRGSSSPARVPAEWSDPNALRPAIGLHFVNAVMGNTIMIFTIGYEGIDLSRFISLLGHHSVETVVDIREMPLSRKPGFSKTALRASLNLSGFEYTHVAALGCPKDVRNQYRVDGNWSLYKKGFLRYLASQEAEIAALAALTASSNCALLCFEADHNYCHRSMVANAVSAVSGAKVKHIGVTQSVKTARTDSWAFA